jgi:hypothetical protein
MVRAILDGEKTQTRRAVKPSVIEAIEFLGGGLDDGPAASDSVELRYEQHIDDKGRTLGPDWLVSSADYPEEGVIPIGQGYGAIGDLLWVRETWYPSFRRTKSNSGCVYRADDNGRDLNPGWSPNGKGGGWKSSIHMPHWASRITLSITKVRIERLQDITEADAKAEGVQPAQCCHAHYHGYRLLWEQINGKGSWERNPWVWAISFQRLE